jgi:hypothetical protein
VKYDRVAQATALLVREGLGMGTSVRYCKKCDSETDHVCIKREILPTIGIAINGDYVQSHYECCVCNIVSVEAKTEKT